MQNKKYLFIWPNANDNSPTFLFQLSNRGRFLSYVGYHFGVNLLFFVLFFFLGFLLFIGFLGDSNYLFGGDTDTLSGTEIVLIFLLGLVIYLDIFFTWIRLPWIFTRQGFYAPAPLYRLLRRHRALLQRYADIRDISFRKLDTIPTTTANTRVKTFQRMNAWIGDFQLFARSRTLQKVEIGMKDGKQFRMSLNLYEDVFPFVRESVGDQWNEGWYVPKREDKIYFQRKGMDRDH